MRYNRKKDGKTSDKAIKLLKEKTDFRQEYFALLKKYINELEKSNENIKSSELACILGILIDEIDDLHKGMTGSCEAIAGLIESRNTISKWIEDILNLETIIKSHA